MTIETYSGAQLLQLATESACDDGSWLTVAVENFNRIIARGDGIAVYENHDLSHPEHGHRKYVSYGSAMATIIEAEPPQRLPDSSREINWRYQLTGTCREPVPDPPPVTEVLGVPAGQSPVLLHYTVALDNYEPVPRKTGHGQIVRYTSHDGGLAWKLFEDELQDAASAVYLIDDGRSVTAAYVAGWGPAGDREGDPYILLDPFPVNPDGRTGPSGRVIDYANWMLGPRRAYHLKVSRAALAGSEGE